MHFYMTLVIWLFYYSLQFLYTTLTGISPKSTSYTKLLEGVLYILIMLVITKQIHIYIP